MNVPRRYRAGELVEDACRSCHVDRMHTVMVADANGRPLRVVCGYCGSEHNFRGGPRDAPSGGSPARGSAGSFARSANTPSSGSGSSGGGVVVRPAAAAPRGEPLPLVSDRERAAPVDAFSSVSSRPSVASPDVSSGGPLATTSTDPESSDSLSESNQAMDLELLLRRVIREESGLTQVVPADRWRGGELVLRPGKPGLQEKSWPIDTFFHKVVMIRNRLRTLEQQLNASDLPTDAKVKLQTYITGCYGSLTSFNVLFADEEDQFKGSSTE